MPGLPDGDTKPVEISGAICAPPPREENDDSSNQVVGAQPRQPANLQGLLRFAMEATKSEDAPHDSQLLPMDEERKKFLEDALKSMSIDVVQILQKQIQTLQKVSTLQTGQDDTEYNEAIETILEYVDNIDIANDFHKIGGFTIIKPCLQCSSPKVRAGACGLLAECCQNNPYCQKVVLDNEFLPILLHILETESDSQVLVKALYALSCIVRENTEGFNQLIHYRGLDILQKLLQKNDEKCIVKITFLLAALCRTQPDLKSRLVFLDYLPVLIGIISQDQKPCYEHVLELVRLLVEEDPHAIYECKNEKYNLKSVLQNYVSSVRNKEERMEEELLCKVLLNIIFGTTA